MSAREFVMNVTILSAIMAVAALIEAAVPMFAHTCGAGSIVCCRGSG